MAVMARSLLVVPAASGAGLTETCLGIVRALDRRGVHVAFVNAVAEPRSDGGPDRSGGLVAAMTALRPPEPFALPDLEQQLGEGGTNVVLEKIVAAWEPVFDSCDVVVVEALGQGPARPYAAEFNQALARALDADVVLTARWPPDLAARYTAGQPAGAGPDRAGAAAENVADTLAITARGYLSGETARVVGCVVHDLPARDAPAAPRLAAALRSRGLRLLAGVPYRRELTWPRVADLVRSLQPRVLSEGDLSRRIKDIAVFAQGVPGGLRVLTGGRLVVVPGDRHDVIMAACLAALNGTQLAGLLLSAGIEPDPRVRELTQATSASGLPILVVDDDSYETASRVRDVDPGLSADDLERAEAVTGNVADALDQSWTDSLPSPSRSRRLSPAAFRYQLVERARAAGARLVLPEGTEPRTVQAAVACAERGIARSVLLGPPDQVAGVVRSLGLRLPDGVTVVDPQAVAEQYVAPLARLRRHRGWTEEMAREQLADPVTVGTMMVWSGEVDGMVSGAAHTTAATVRPALQILGTGPGSRLVSSVFFMCLPDEVVIYGDCAINPQPDAEDLADIAIQSATSARAFGIEPRVAMISFSTGSSAADSDVDKVARATQIVREREPGLAVDGPLQYDAAAVASVGQAKRPGSTVAGRATVFIFPDLDAGNTTYKAVQRSANVVSIGPMLQGLAKPVNDLSRGAQVDDIIYTLALTAVQARGLEAVPGSAGSVRSGSGQPRK
jgi:phosphate acetyltransferase